MALTDLVPAGGAVLGVVLGAGGLVWLRSLGAGARPVTAEDIASAAPIELRTAVYILADPLQTNLMLAALGLGSVKDGFPKLERYDYSTFGLEVDVLMLGGQSLADWSKDETLNQFATYLGVPKVTASSPEPSWVRLQVRVFDTLVAPATRPETVHNVVDLEAVPVGVTEDYETWRLRVLYAHILLAGATGSGKGSVIWSILAGLGVAILAGLVDVRLADPKGGAEFGRGENKLFTRFAVDTDSILAMLREAVEEMDERLVRMRQAGLRKLVPTTDEPLILIIIDEAASLSSYADRAQQEEFRQLTGLLLSKGRAAGVSVVAALQDPSKETMPNRQLFPVRIGLRLDEPTQTAMVHGQGSRDRGARCDEINEHTPGVGYVGQDGSTGFVRVRAFWVSDEDADAIVDAYSPAAEITGPTQDYTGFDPDDLGDENEDGVAA
ncbi:FtsK/SpoIIIE domain-containing protein [Nocardia suismassiliense]|uniref:FtsK/SpoIIIE domain-containing protein n=1 Tax=Nocardia suismassiliense TaxID=2077092 RepID=UPI000D1E03BC|nr:FtsK/SpoIIIE domain-containing protein [Nocardia suismassiliense]